MPRFLTFTITVVLIAVLGPFFFPWPFALALGVVASLFFPPAVILTGLLIDVLYFNTNGAVHHAFPYFTISA